ncbi:MAG: phosphoribosylformylglycinamidine synthase subunit PurS [Gemmatimonadota bacterium]
MTRFHLEIRVKPRPGLLDPEGKAVHHALQSLDFSGVAEVRVGKVIDIEIDATDRSEALERVREMCRKLLANPVTEDFDVRVADQIVYTGDAA